jgi:sugar/nucleoside kinase (ribokinase family)
MKLTKSQLKEMIKQELREAGLNKYTKGVDSQDNVGNVFITKHDTGDITFHIGGKSDSSIIFNRRQIKDVMKKLKKMGA